MDKRKVLFETSYHHHYSRVNRSLNPRIIEGRIKINLERMYGPYLANLVEKSRVLDLGCGTGYLLHWLSKKPGLVPLGVDLCPFMVREARRELPELEIALGDGLEYMRNSEKNSFSAIFCHDVLEHLPSEETCVEWVTAARHALIPGGALFCRVPNAANLAGFYMRHIDFTHKRLFTSFSLVQLLETGGLSDCRIIPTKYKSSVRRFHLDVLNFVHRSLFLFCGLRTERYFDKLLFAAGFNGSEPPRRA